jgi:hypothetical protein
LPVDARNEKMLHRPQLLSHRGTTHSVTHLALAPILEAYRSMCHKGATHRSAAFQNGQSPFDAVCATPQIAAKPADWPTHAQTSVKHPTQCATQAAVTSNMPNARQTRCRSQNCFNVERLNFMATTYYIMPCHTRRYHLGLLQDPTCNHVRSPYATTAPVAEVERASLHILEMSKSTNVEKHIVKQHMHVRQNSPPGEPIQTTLELSLQNGCAAKHLIHLSEPPHQYKKI